MSLNILKPKELLKILLKETDEKDTTQNSIPYKEIYKDGICRVTKDFFCKQIEFFDINYQLSNESDKNIIFEKYCDFLNYFDETVSVQLLFLNQKVDIKELEKIINIKNKNDNLSDVRKEFCEMLRNNLKRGQNSIKKTKYIIFGIHAESYDVAKPKLERIESAVLMNFKRLGCKTVSLDGYDRLKILHSILNPNRKFNFSWDLIPKTGLTTKDFIAPDSFTFKDRNTFKIGSLIGTTSFVEINASDLSDRLLADILNIETVLNVSFHIKSVDQTKAIKIIKKKLSDIDKMKIEEQMKAVRNGYDMDIMSTDIITYGDDSKEFLEDLQSRNERMFLITLMITNFGKNKEELENNRFQIQSILQSANCTLRFLDYQQEQGFMSSLPFANNLINIKRGTNTRATAAFVPFTTQELFQPEKESLYYGLNPLSNNIIMADRKTLKNPNGLIFGSPGSGKSFSAKKEIVNASFTTTDDIVILDPEDEYGDIVRQLQGTVVDISISSKNYINILDINNNYSEEDDPLTLKFEFMVSFFELIIHGELLPEEKSMLDRCMRKCYEKYFENPIFENMPILEDLYNALYEQYKKTHNPYAEHLYGALELYVTGSMNIFNHRTNVDENNRIICFNTKKLGKQLKKLGMLIIQDHVWGRVTLNRSKKKSTRFYIDEFHLLLRDEQTASYSVEIWKRFRKWGGIPTGITQNVKDLLASREIENILENSDFICMLNQAPDDREILAKRLNISDEQLGYVTGVNAGEGLIFFGNTVIPFVDRFPRHTKLYKMMTTKLEER